MPAELWLDDYSVSPCVSVTYAAIAAGAGNENFISQKDKKSDFYF